MCSPLPKGLTGLTFGADGADLGADGADLEFRYCLRCKL
jgi:hypothetical protein